MKENAFSVFLHYYYTIFMIAKREGNKTIRQWLKKWSAHLIRVL